MKRTMRGGHRLALVSITAVLTWLGSGPAFADEVPLVTTPTTTVDAPTTVVGQVSDAATSVVGAVDTAADSTVDTASNVATGASDTIADAASNAGGSVAASAGNLTDAVTNGTGTGDAGSDTSATVGSSDRTGGSSSHAGSSSASTQGASPLRSDRERTVLTPVVGAVQATAPCPDAGGPSCSATSGTSDEDSLAQKISEVIGLLALTGFVLLPWIAAAVALTVLGSVALERARGTGSRAPRVSAA